MNIIYVDIDGTLTVETEGWGVDVYTSRTPRQNVIDHVNCLYNSGNQIVIWTARFEMDRHITSLWLKKHCVQYHRLLMGKPKFDLYICDKVKNVEEISNGY